MKLEGLKILITGAAGFIGSHLADRLADGNELLLVDDFSIGTMDNLGVIRDRPNVEIVNADVRDRDRMIALAKGIDVFFHLAISCLRTSINHPFLNHDINAGGTLNACIAARKNSLGRFIYVSSSEIYGTAEAVPMAEEHPARPTTVYGASKLAGETYALAYWKTYGMPVTVVRPFNTYGPREPYQGSRAEVIPRFFLQLTNGSAPIIYGDGLQTRDFTFVEESVTGLVLAAESDALVGDVVNIAYGQEVSILKIAELLAELMGKRDLGIQHAEPRPGDVRRHLADISKARNMLGFVPSIDIRTGLARCVEWFEASNISARVEGKASGLPNW